MPLIWAAGIGAAGSLVGGLIGSSGASSAANAQANAAQNATNAQLSMFNQVQGNEAPFRQAGQAAMSDLSFLTGGSTGVNQFDPRGGEVGFTGQGAANIAGGGMGSLNAPFTIDQFHKMSPAYQFQLQQGQQGTLNQDAMSQGSLSGAALKDLQAFNQNYANTSFNNAFNQYQTQQNNVFNRLSTLAGIGQSAASNQATGASSFASGIGQSLSNIGAAQAGGIVGSTNAITGSLNNALPWLYATQMSPNSAGGGNPFGQA